MAQLAENVPAVTAPRRLLDKRAQQARDQHEKGNQVHDCHGRFAPRFRAGERWLNVQK